MMNIGAGKRGHLDGLGQAALVLEELERRGLVHDVLELRGRDRGLHVLIVRDAVAAAYTGVTLFAGVPFEFLQVCQVSLVSFVNNYDCSRQVAGKLLSVM